RNYMLIARDWHQIEEALANRHDDADLNYSGALALLADPLGLAVNAVGFLACRRRLLLVLLGLDLLLRLLLGPLGQYLVPPRTQLPLARLGGGVGQMWGKFLCQPVAPPAVVQVAPPRGEDPPARDVLGPDVSLADAAVGGGGDVQFPGHGYPSTL